MIKRIIRNLVSREEIERNLVDVVKKYITGEVDLKASYKDLGISDIDILEIIAMTEYNLDADLKEDDAVLLTTIPDTLDLFEKYFLSKETSEESEKS